MLKKKALSCCAVVSFFSTREFQNVKLRNKRGQWQGTSQFPPTAGESKTAMTIYVPLENRSGGKIFDKNASRRKMRRRLLRQASQAGDRTCGGQLVLAPAKALSTRVTWPRPPAVVPHTNDVIRAAKECRNVAIAHHGGANYIKSLPENRHQEKRREIETGADQGGKQCARERRRRSECTCQARRNFRPMLRLMSHCCFREGAPVRENSNPKNGLGGGWIEKRDLPV